MVGHLFDIEHQEMYKCKIAQAPTAKANLHSSALICFSIPGHQGWSQTPTVGQGLRNPQFPTDSLPPTSQLSFYILYLLIYEVSFFLIFSSLVV